SHVGFHAVHQTNVLAGTARTLHRHVDARQFVAEKRCDGRSGRAKGAPRRPAGEADERRALGISEGRGIPDQRCQHPWEQRPVAHLPQHVVNPPSRSFPSVSSCASGSSGEHGTLYAIVCASPPPPATPVVATTLHQPGAASAPRSSRFGSPWPQLAVHPSETRGRVGASRHRGGTISGRLIIRSFNAPYLLSSEITWQVQRSPASPNQTIDQERPVFPWRACPSAAAPTSFFMAGTAGAVWNDSLLPARKLRGG